MIKDQCVFLLVVVDFSEEPSLQVNVLFRKEPEEVRLPRLVRYGFGRKELPVDKRSLNSQNQNLGSVRLVSE